MAEEKLRANIMALGGFGQLGHSEFINEDGTLVDRKTMIDRYSIRPGDAHDLRQLDDQVEGLGTNYVMAGGAAALVTLGLASVLAVHLFPNAPEALAAWYRPLANQIAQTWTDTQASMGEKRRALLGFSGPAPTPTPTTPAPVVTPTRTGPAKQPPGFPPISRAPAQAAAAAIVAPSPPRTTNAAAGSSPTPTATTPSRPAPATIPRRFAADSPTPTTPSRRRAAPAFDDDTPTPTRPRAPAPAALPFPTPRRRMFASAKKTAPAPTPLPLPTPPTGSPPPRNAAAQQQKEQQEQGNNDLQSSSTAPPPPPIHIPLAVLGSNNTAATSLGSHWATFLEAMERAGTFYTSAKDAVAQKAGAAAKVVSENPGTVLAILATGAVASGVIFHVLTRESRAFRRLASHVLRDDKGLYRKGMSEIREWAAKAEVLMRSKTCTPDAVYGELCSSDAREAAEDMDSSRSLVEFRKRIIGAANGRKWQLWRTKKTLLAWHFIDAEGRERQPLEICRVLCQDLDALFEEARDSGPISMSLSFEAYQKRVAKKFKQFALPPTSTLVSGCGGKQGTILEFHQTQGFVMNYFLPSAPVKGMLLAWDPGAGKTAAAIGTISNGWEQEGYSILWVTRGPLKEDIVKNQFVNIAHLRIQDLVTRGVVKYPISDAVRATLLPRWLPISTFRTFSNACGNSQHNDLVDKLKKRNGTADRLARTLIIIDEAHKLLDADDLLPAEKPDLAEIQRAIYASYATSGADSVRLLLMSATPLVRDPTDLAKLLNLLIPTAEGRIEDGSLDRFKELYADEKGTDLTANGEWDIAEKAKGLVSYLGKTRDRTLYAQVKEHVVEVEFPLPPFDIDFDKRRGECRIAGSKSARQCARQVTEDAETYQRLYQLGAISRSPAKRGPKHGEFVRKIDNISHMGMYEYVGGHGFNKQAFADKLRVSSPKVWAMMENIKRLDDEDMARDGVLYKHVIFSDVIRGYGLRVVLTALQVVFGANFVQKKSGKNLVLDEAAIRAGQKEVVLKSTGGRTMTSNNVAVLSKSAIVGGCNQTPADGKYLREDFFNVRPANIYGANVRIILFDASYKEGIDLLDVKYKHALEEQKSDADRVQAAGRSTRLCSTEGLPFDKLTGWTQHSYSYMQILSPEVRRMLGTEGETLAQYAFQELGIDTSTEVLSKQMIATMHEIAVDRELNVELHR